VTFRFNILNEYIPSSHLPQEMSFRLIDSDEYIGDVPKVKAIVIAQLLDNILFEEDHVKIGYRQG
jgi:predicted RNA methylase